MDIEKIGGGLVNLILGALILWVAQTTFHHSGELAGVDQKFDSIATQYDNLRDRLDRLMNQVNERTRSRFTREDGDQIAGEVEEINAFCTGMERRLVDRLNEVQLKVIALETRGVDQRELGLLRTDIERLTASLYPPSRKSTRSDFSGTRVEVARPTAASTLRLR